MDRSSLDHDRFSFCFRRRARRPLSDTVQMWAPLLLNLSRYDISLVETALKHTRLL
jgi:hypothetical protein